MNKIIGVAHPIEKRFMNRFLLDKKDVFIKPAKCFQFLEPGMLFFFYQSREDTGYVGEAIIVKINISQDIRRLLSTYKNRNFLSDDEMEEYISNIERRKTHRRRYTKVEPRKWMAIELKEIRKYDNPIKPKHFVPIGGRYQRADSNIK